jgi:hypothetical protein
MANYIIPQPRPVVNAIFGFFAIFMRDTGGGLFVAAAGGMGFLNTARPGRRG